ncbi:tyrosine-type recombinase/integrase [Xanthomonas hyacinthi]|uniref:tyrosine-type recombinase/integrase n=1 Tax=Xanthomonas hyacinthi TaxID=56455 RepID=UPI000AF9B8ED|nr:integrase arm-type DNA-binding domain-containing protein [Xanthomonas hyacinthi]
MPLTAREVQTAQFQDKSYGLADGNGLFLWVTPEAQKYWHFRYRINGKQPRISLGVYPTVSLQLAREKAHEARLLVARGIDPGQKRKDDRCQSIETRTNLFKDAAEDWIKAKQDAGRSASTLDKMRTYLDKDILPVLGNKYLPEVSRANCVDVQTRIDEARSAKRRQEGPRLATGNLQPRHRQGQVRTQPSFRTALCRQGSPQIHPLPASAGAEASRLPARPGSLHQPPDQSNCGLDGALDGLSSRHDPLRRVDGNRPGRLHLDHPGREMKMRRKHVTPLPTRLIAQLKALHLLTGRHQYLFPGIGTKNPTISENTINNVFQLIGYKGRMVGHGSRHTASTLLREHNWAKQLVDAQLSHKEKAPLATTTTRST